jgi:hypothetical protein
MRLDAASEMGKESLSPLFSAGIASVPTSPADEVCRRRAANSGNADTQPRYLGGVLFLRIAFAHSRLQAYPIDLTV